MPASWAASEFVAIARGSNRSGTSMGPRALAVGWKNARVHPNRAARAKTGQSPPPSDDRNASPTDVRSWAR